MMRAPVVLSVAFIAVPLWAAAQSGASNDGTPVPLTSMVGGASRAAVPAAPSGDASARTLPAPDLPAPDLPAASLVMPPVSGHVPRNTRPAQVRPSPGGVAAAQVKPMWNRRRGAVLDVLDKEDGAVHRITVDTGSQVTEGKLAIAVAACVVRPSDMTPDAAMFVTVTKVPGRGDAAAASTAASPVFRGWLIRSEPGATVIGDAAVTFRLIGCKGS